MPSAHSTWKATELEFTAMPNLQHKLHWRKASSLATRKLMKIVTQLWMQSHDVDVNQHDLSYQPSWGNDDRQFFLTRVHMSVNRQFNQMLPGHTSAASARRIAAWQMQHQFLFHLHPQVQATHTHHLSLHCCKACLSRFSQAGNCSLRWIWSIGQKEIIKWACRSSF